LFSLVQGNGYDKCNSWISQFWYAITNAFLIHRMSIKCYAFLLAEQQISRYYILGQNSNTRGPLVDTTALKSERHDFIFQNDRQWFRILLWHWLEIFNLTSLPLPSWHFRIITSYRMHSYLKKYSAKKEFHLTCETWTACKSKIIQISMQLANAHWHFFPNQKNSFSCSLLNFCTTAQ
jgi:hypothetical protein